MYGPSITTQTSPGVVFAHMMVLFTLFFQRNHGAPDEKAVPHTSINTIGATSAVNLDFTYTPL